MATPMTCAGLFEKFKDTAVLTSAEQFARWTNAGVFPNTSAQDTGNRQALQRDYQSKGAMLVNNLASKVTQALFPQNSAFFEISQTPEMLQIAQQMGADAKAAASLFAGLEARASARVFLNAGYSALSHAAKLLIITGNALVYRDPVSLQFHTYSVRDYVVKRDGSGKVLCTILKERIALMDLPEDFRLSRLPHRTEMYEDITLYTKVERKTLNGRVVYEVSQEVEDHSIGTPSIYPEYLCPYIPLTWNLVTGENYGRGHVEDFAGDFARLSELSESSLLYEAEMMRLINIIDPGAGIDLDDFMDADCGKAVSGKTNAAGNGVVAHEGGNAQKLAAVQNDIAALMQQLSIAFMYTGNTRDAERVTAEEIRANISEANQTLGGVYANLSEVLHLHLAHILVVEEESQMLQLLMVQGVKLDVSVGLASLNRQANVEKLQYLANAIQLVIPALTQSSPRFNPDLVIDALCQGYGIDREALSYTDDQLKQLQQQQDQSAQQSILNAQGAESGQGADPQLAALNSQQLGLTQ